MRVLVFAWIGCLTVPQLAHGSDGDCVLDVGAEAGSYVENPEQLRDQLERVIRSWR